MNKNKVYTHVSLFSGAGGLDIGLEQAGFHTVWANDFNHDACETHRLWSNATVVEGDIGKVDYDTIPDCDIASFGFPCQGFSLSGPRKIDDSRNVLYRHCVKLVEKKQPKLFLAENVKGLLTLGDGKIKDRIALIRVTSDEPLTQRYGFLRAVRCAFLLISSKGQNARWKSLGAVVAFCLVFPVILGHLRIPLMLRR